MNGINQRQHLSADDRAVINEVFRTLPGQRFLAALINLRPPIGGATDEAALSSARIAQGYEQCISTISVLLTDPQSVPELKSVPVSED